MTVDREAGRAARTLAQRGDRSIKGEVRMATARTGKSTRSQAWLGLLLAISVLVVVLFLWSGSAAAQTGAPLPVRPIAHPQLATDIAQARPVVERTPLERAGAHDRTLHRPARPASNSVTLEAPTRRAGYRGGGPASATSSQPLMTMGALMLILAVLWLLTRREERLW